MARLGVNVDHVATLRQARGTDYPDPIAAALLVEPDSIDALAEGMLRVLTHTSLARELVAKGLQRAQLFTWERAAGETLAVYQDVYRHRRRVP